MLRLKQHGLRSPAVSLENAVSIRRLRVSNLLVEPIQRIHSQRAIGVISIHRFCTLGLPLRAPLRSAGTAGSGHSLVDSTASFTASPTAAFTDFCIPLSTV